MKRLAILFFIYSCNAFHVWDVDVANNQAIPAKTFIVNLDSPPTERLYPVAYKQEFRKGEGEANKRKF